MSDLKEMENPQPVIPPDKTVSEVSEALYKLRGHLAGPISILLSANLGLGSAPKLRWTITVNPDQWTGDTLAVAMQRAIDDAQARNA